ncbi:response regulator transcription factor [Brevundimonas sp. Root1423]|uniref:response regulator transcription factor n=1 Tax=Brevundimonas sp. Root1423 TaxID=1736462 RepID=UPI0006F35360|nr:response regulator transcription factor [Brevundimonas sp. Root1423]KQY75390.1 hypothetical protein ASD25_12710 [Brevundimonas sp. Root1423]
MRVLLVEDEAPLADVIATSLTAAGMEVNWAGDLAGARRALVGARYDLVLLDLHLPDGDGRSLLHPGHRLPPVIVLSALGEEADVVELLDLGARDFIRKPFRVGELLARMKAVVRPVAAPDNGTFPLQFDSEARCLYLGRERIHLSKLEARLYRALLHMYDRPVTYERLIAEVWEGPGKDAAALRVLISQLRQKIEPDFERPNFIMSERGIGYRLTNSLNGQLEN